VVVALSLVAIGAMAGLVLSLRTVVAALRQVSTQRSYWLVPQKSDKQIEMPFAMPASEPRREGPATPAPRTRRMGPDEDLLTSPEEEEFETVMRRP